MAKDDSVWTAALEEIVVIARKRDESVQDIPIAVSTLPKSIIEDGNFEHVDIDQEKGFQRTPGRTYGAQLTYTF